MSTPDQLHVVTVSGSSGAIMHTILGQVNSFGNVNQQESNRELQFAVVDCTGVGGALHVCGIATNKAIYHTIRNADGSWQGSSGDVNSENAGAGYAFVDVSCAGVETSGDVHVCAIGTSGTLLHTIRTGGSSPGWQGFYGDVNSENAGGSSHPAPFTHVACATLDDTLHICALDANGAVWHTFRLASGRWQGFFAPTAPSLDKALDLSCATIGTDLHLCIVSAQTSGFQHTQRPVPLSWNPHSASPLEQATWWEIDNAPPQSPPPQPAPPPSAIFQTVACANVNNALHVCGTDTLNRIWHIVRTPTWQPPYENVNQAQGSSERYAVVSVGGVV